MNKTFCPLRPLAAVALGFALASCTTTNPYTGEDQASKKSAGAAGGAALGGLLGGIIGNNVGDNNAARGAVIGAGIGALAGGAAGKRMDEQEAALRAQLQATGVSVTRSGNNIILNMPHDVTFATGKDTIKPDFYDTLNSVAIVLRKYDKTRVGVHGHTDSDGSASFNRGLSERRARSVADALARNGVAGNRLIVRGFGESQPVASNSTTAGKARNRRVEIHIEPTS